MSPTNEMQIDGSGNITLQNIQGSTITITKGDDANTIIEKLNQLHEALLDGLLQFVEMQGELVEDLFKQILQEFAKSKGVEKKKFVTIQVHSGSGDNVAGDKIVIYNIYHIKQTTDPFVATHKNLTGRGGKNISLEILERHYLLDKLQALITAGNRYIVLYGNEGIGKTTFMSLYYNQYSRGKYDQIGWFLFTRNLAETLVVGLSKYTFEEKPKTDWDKLYYREALDQIKQLKNYLVENMPTSKLLVFDDVLNEEIITTHYHDLLHINDHTVFVFIAKEPFKDERFKNFELPRLTDEEVKTILGKFFTKESQSEYATLINGNFFLTQLLIKNAPKEGERATQNFAVTLIGQADNNIAEKDQQLTETLFRVCPLNSFQTWLLLQFAVLPAGAYDTMMIKQYLFSEKDETEIEQLCNEDYLSLSSYLAFAKQD